MSDTTIETVMSLIESEAPKCLLVASQKLSEILRHAAPSCEIIDLKDEPSSFEASNDLVRRVDLVVLAELLDTLTHEDAIRLIGIMRNQLNARLIILTTNETPLRFNDLIGLGCKRELNTENGACVYSYDIANYNKKREWNNSRFWANPENFSKYRW